MMLDDEPLKVIACGDYSPADGDVEIEEASSNSQETPGFEGQATGRRPGHWQMFPVPQASRRVADAFLRQGPQCGEQLGGLTWSYWLEETHEETNSKHSNPLAVASTLEAMASSLLAMASTLESYRFFTSIDALPILSYRGIGEDVTCSCLLTLQFLQSLFSTYKTCFKTLLVGMSFLHA